MDVSFSDLSLIILTILSFCILKKLVQIQDNTSPVLIKDINIKAPISVISTTKPVSELEHFQTESFEIKDDGRPFQDFYRNNSNFEETSLCTNGSFDCKEQNSIANIFNFI